MTRGCMEPEALDWFDIVAAVNVVLFAVFMVIGALTTTRRWRRYRVNKIELPRLLWRDLLVGASLAIPIGAGLALRLARTWGVDIAAITDSGWWSILSTTIPMLGAATYVYYEIFVIERTEQEKAAEYDPFDEPFGDL